MALGKSTLAKAIVSKIRGDGGLQDLVPFKHRGNAEAAPPEVEGIDDLASPDAIAGSLFSNANFRKVMDTLRNAADLRKARPGFCIWLVPQVTAWGATRALPVMLDQFTDRLASDDGQSLDEEPVRSIALVAGRLPNHLRETFDLVVSGHDVAGIPPGLEIMLVPGLMAAICIHLPVEAARAFPVPVGLLTFDDHVIERIRSVLQECSRYFTAAGNGTNLPELRSLLDQALD
jgi:hypothetical protein